ncbi:hypothetical protein [Pseudomonas fluorescens]|uniref:DUF4189 domain-containing protein n=1 Tax=Pseudomonas fluorescens TaxID=294 RepID=A0A5E7VUS4_PSEFL|nr:hypothetical protein [Pseudomonas fluorescens]VVQ26432.1 hypothetical protein PS928_06594 [Pseudomonas fluorescens]
MTRLIPIIILGAFLLSNLASADIWIWYMTKDERPYYQVAASEKLALEKAREHHDTFDTSGPKLLEVCNKKGFFALIAYSAPGNATRFGGACDQQSREKSYAAAIKSCKEKPACKAAMEDKDWRVDMNSFQDDGKEIQLRIECIYVRSSDNNCSEYDAEGGNINYPFDLVGFLKQYGEP